MARAATTSAATRPNAMAPDNEVNLVARRKSSHGEKLQMRSPMSCPFS